VARRTKSELRAHAFHEAGHAAVAMALGVVVTRIDIRGRGEYAGGTTTFSSGVPPEKDIIILLAGVEAQARHLGVDPKVVANDGYNDMQEISRIVRAHNGQSGLAIGGLRRDCRRLIESQWQLIDAIADRLAQKTKLDEFEIALITLKVDARHAS
jgi:hypothetical protein